MLTDICVNLLNGQFRSDRTKVIERARLAGVTRMMLTATLFAGLFLVAYITRWATYGSKPFEGEGAWRLFYLINLIPHIILAIAVGPLALYLIYLALKQRDFRTHRKIGRITVPIWLYVAGSGWLIYFLLYKMTF